MAVDTSTANKCDWKQAHEQLVPPTWGREPAEHARLRPRPPRSDAPS
jgi:hypothetical protein